jgi:hypothetical protein
MAKPAATKNTPMGRPAIEVAVAKALKTHFYDLDIYQDDFGHANYGVYIQLQGDQHAGFYGLLSQEGGDYWVLGLYTTDDLSDGIDFIAFKNLPSETNEDARVWPSAAKIAETAAPAITKALARKVKFERPLTADLTVALKADRDELGRPRFTSSSAFGNDPPQVFDMLGQTEAIVVWEEKGKWKARVEEINHKDWKPLMLDMAGLKTTDPLEKVAAQVSKIRAETAANLNAVMAGWPQWRSYMVNLGLDPDHALDAPEPEI